MQGHPGDRQRAVIERDAALARIGRTRRWVIVGTAALTAGAAALVSAVAPGRSLGAKPASSASPARSATKAAPPAPELPPLADPSSLGLGAPSEAPQPAAPSNSSPAQSPTDPSQAQSQSAQSQSAQSQAAPTQPQVAPAPATAPASQPAVVSGGS